MAKKPTKPTPKPPAKQSAPLKSAPTAKPARSAARDSSGPTPIAAVVHRDTRANIPTEELRDFVREDEQKKTVLYPRNPDLDPQLVWRGKDEQDRAGLEIPAVPVFIQEKIHPQAIIDDFRRHAPKPAASKAEEQLGGFLFDPYAAFNGLPEDFSARVDFYQHQGHWSNRLILGDSLLVMNSLAEKEGLKGRVQMVYFDPPYGIKFGSNWQVSTRKRDVKDGKAEDVVRQPEQMRAFRDTWELGIHSYLSYLRDRLTTARELLTESGSIFVQIGDENVHLVRSILDEVFGSENFVAQIWFQTKKMSFGAKYLEGMGDYLLFYAKNKECVKYRQLFMSKETESDPHYSYIELPDGKRRTMTKEEKEDRTKLPAQSKVFIPLDLRPAGFNASGNFIFRFNGKPYHPGHGKSWKTNERGMSNLAMANRLYETSSQLTYVLYVDDYPVTTLKGTWSDSEGAYDPTYVVQTSTKVIQRCLLMTTDPGDLVIDPTCGSGTTAYVAEQWGRRWITTDTSRVAITLARTRLMAARFPSYYLAEQYPQVGTSADDNAIRQHLRTATPAVPAEKADIRRGFVYKRVPHVTLKSIANNPDIKEGMSRAEIDRAIAKHADSEILYDKPFQDDKAVRVCGPFTVESLSPHRTMSLHERRDLSTKGDTNEAGETRTLKQYGPDDFGRLVLDNMKRSGVQNTFKGEKMVFESLDPHPGEWIQAVGSYTDKAGKPVRVGVCIGPEHGTVGPDLVKEAAKEAVRGVGFDTLLIAGFAFDPHVGEEAKRYGKLTVLTVRINSDLAMGDLLKKTGAGNLFMIFGEPDIEIRDAKKSEMPADAAKDAKVADYAVVEIHGLDVYDPTTGEVRSSTTDDIACWFLDTHYNGESFFVRHAYFTGAGAEKGEGPYDKLKRALKAEVDESAWASLYSTVSRPFLKPKGERGKAGKIAIKVINHFGDEVLTVVEVK